MCAAEEPKCWCSFPSAKAWKTMIMVSGGIGLGQHVDSRPSCNHPKWHACWKLIYPCRVLLTNQALFKHEVKKNDTMFPEYCYITIRQIIPSPFMGINPPRHVVPGRAGSYAYICTADSPKNMGLISMTDKQPQLSPVTHTGS